MSGLLILASFLCEESPRHLCRIGKCDRARRALGKIWGLPDDHQEISAELAGIQEQMQNEQEHSLYGSWIASLKELLLVRSNMKRLLFVISAQLLSQWSGANSLTSALHPYPVVVARDANMTSSICTRVIFLVWNHRPVGEALHDRSFRGRQICSISPLCNFAH